MGLFDTMKNAVAGKFGIGNRGEFAEAVAVAYADGEVDDKATAVLRKFGWRN